MVMHSRIQTTTDHVVLQYVFSEKKNLCISGLAQFTHVTIISILQIAKRKSHYIFAQFYIAGTW